MSTRYPYSSYSLNVSCILMNCKYAVYKIKLKNLFAFGHYLQLYNTLYLQFNDD